MAEVRWHFRRMHRAEISHDPMEREFFSGERISERLVREAAQNSLDAGLAHLGRRAGEPVRMRISLRGAREPLDAASADGYVGGLEEHLAAGLDADESFLGNVRLRGLVTGAGMPYLVVEDAGTVGLEGDWLRYDDSGNDRAEGEHFYWFFRNVGRSGKTAEDAGSWGLGKWVFPDASNASAFIAVTRRRSDGETLLMGQAVLKKHTLEGERYAPYGFFAELDGDELPVPLRLSKPEHRGFIEQCISDFDLRFRERNESGLSIVIPFPRVDSDQISKEQTLLAVIHNYFYPIIAGQLEVTVGDGVGEEGVVTADSIDAITESLPLESSGERSRESYLRLFRMCREAAFVRHVELGSPPLNRTDYAERDKIVRMKGAYDRGDLLAFRVGASVQRREAGREQETGFRLYVQKDDSLSQGHDYYVRGPLAIPGEDHLGSRSARSLLVVEEQEPLAGMLRDSEPPAHTSWRPQDERVAKRWVGPSSRIKRVRESAAELLSIWETIPVGLDKDALADIFPSGGGSRPRPPKPKDGGDEGKGPPDVIDPPPADRQFDIEKVRDGFRARFAGDAGDPPRRVRLRAAYETPRGNPLTSYNENDFRLFGSGAVAVEARGCSVAEGERGNELLLDVEDSDRFSVTVRGFDPHRDLLVDLQAVGASSRGAEGQG